ncbi:Chloride channel protein 2 [Fragariocoptes setiger]|uniref:Chloride channel protein 2 n=1 Tax=Fragariocoptes setiger TaxID=1670756 RepID=A0ABQ7S5A8_9ACAR|nr:Chloride channel protein 2 [Fragariocoptes setiger]
MIRNMDGSLLICHSGASTLKRFINTTFVQIGGDWLFLASLGTIMALLSFSMDTVISMFLNARSTLFHDLDGKNIVLEYLGWCVLPIILVTFSTKFVQVCSPAAVGSGIPEMKTILRGVILNEYLTFRTLVGKIVGLTCTLGSGLPLGKEGPFVHVASIVATLLSKAVASFQGDFYQNESRTSEMLSAACAVGVAATFYAPIGGVLFSIEVTTVYFAVRNYWRGFFAACCGATLMRLLTFWIKNDESITALFRTSFRTEYPFDPLELIAFSFIGVTCGLTGAAYIKFHRIVVQFFRRHKKISEFLHKNRFVYPVLVTLLITTVTFPPFIGKYTASTLSTHATIEQLFSNRTWSLGSVDLETDTILSNWTTDNSGFHFHLASYILMMFWTSALASTIPIPSGLFIPVLKMGAAYGRLLGEILHAWFPDGISYGDYAHTQAIVPGSYAVVGAAALSGAVTHTISTSVILFEMTGQIVHIIPVILAVLIANAVCQSLQPSIYDSIIEMKKLPYLPPITSTNSVSHKIVVRDFMTTKIAYVWKDRCTYRDLKTMLILHKKILSFPLVQSPETMILLGSIPRVDLLRLLYYQLGRERRLQEVSRRNSDTFRHKSSIVSTTSNVSNVSSNVASDITFKDSTNISELHPSKKDTERVADPLALDTPCIAHPINFYNRGSVDDGVVHVLTETLIDKNEPHYPSIEVTSTTIDEHDSTNRHDRDDSLSPKDTFFAGTLDEVTKNLSELNVNNQMPTIDKRISSHNNISLTPTLARTDIFPNKGKLSELRPTLKTVRSSIDVPYHDKLRHEQSSASLSSMMMSNVRGNSLESHGHNVHSGSIRSILKTPMINHQREQNRRKKVVPGDTTTIFINNEDDNNNSEEKARQVSSAGGGYGQEQRRRVRLSMLRVIDMTPEEQKEWDREQLDSEVDFSRCQVDAAPFQLVEQTSLYRVHTVFSMLGLNHAYVTSVGRLVGIVALRDIRSAIERMNSGEIAIKMLKLRSKFMLSRNVLSSPWRHAFTIALFVPLILNNNNVSGVRELEILTQMLKKLPEPNDIASSDIVRLMANYSETLTPRASNEPSNDIRENVRPTMINYRSANYAMARIDWPLDQSAFTFHAIEQPRYQIYFMSRSLYESRSGWRDVPSIVRAEIKLLCHGDIENCRELDVKARIAMQKGYNFALSMSRITDSFVFASVVRRDDDTEAFSMVKRGDLPVRIEPFKRDYLVNIDPSVSDAERNAIIRDITEVHNERPINADDYAFFAISTDPWNHDMLTVEVREHLCTEHKTALEADASNAIALSSPEIMSTAYWYLRRFFIPPKNGTVRSTMMLIALLRPIEEICADMKTTTGDETTTAPISSQDQISTPDSSTTTQ